MTERVVIADDHVPTRKGIRTALEQGGFVVIAEAATADDAVKYVKELRPDVALLDVHMPGSGLRAAHDITAACPDIPVVMLTVSDSDEDLFEALRVGARGYLLKDIDPVRLPLSLRGVLDGEAALPLNLVARLVQEFRERRELGGRPSGHLARLTDREWEVLELLRENLSTAQIAKRLFVSAGTVRTHVAAVMHKLHVPDRHAAVRAAYQKPTDHRR